MPAPDAAAAAEGCIPILILIDCEPDLREVPPDDPRPWTGFERYFEFMAESRARLSAATGQPVRFNWFWRMDPQIEQAYGRADWGVATYARQVAEMQRHGDGIGLHTHAWRWDGAAASWIVDHGNGPWIETCLRRSFAAFRQSFGRDCEIFRFGDGWFDAALVPLLEELGARIDLTVEPNVRAQTGVVAHERTTGLIPDRRGVPQSPYRPMRTDFRRCDRGRGEQRLWLLPPSSAKRLRRPRLTRPLALWRWWRSPARRVAALNLGIVPANFRRALRRALKAARPTYAAMAIRSDAGAHPDRLRVVAQNLEAVLAHPDAARFRFVTAAEALAMLTAPASNLAARP